VVTDIMKDPFLPSSGLKLSTEKDSVAIIRSNMNISTKSVLCPLHNGVVSTVVYNVDGRGIHGR
jgi:hypothetical protein